MALPVPALGEVGEGEGGEGQNQQQQQENLHHSPERGRAFFFWGKLNIFDPCFN